jgi:PilZ domain
MGAAPERLGQQAARSPLHERREVEFHTETITAYSGKPGPRKFTRVPTHAIGVAEERRRYPRAHLALPLRLTRIGAVPEPIPVTLVTRNISSSGIYFLAPRHILPGTAIELEVALVERPLGFGTVQMCTAAHVVRAEECDMPGWHGYAATFDDFALRRDDVIPIRFHSS